MDIHFEELRRNFISILRLDFRGFRKNKGKRVEDKKNIYCCNTFTFSRRNRSPSALLFLAETLCLQASSWDSILARFSWILTSLCLLTSTFSASSARVSAIICFKGIGWYKDSHSAAEILFSKLITAVESCKLL